MEQLDKFIGILEQQLKNQTFVKLSLGNYKGDDPELRHIYIKPAVIKKGRVLAFNYRYQTRDIHKNFGFEEGLQLVRSSLITGFKIATLFATSAEVIFEYDKKGLGKVRTQTQVQQRQIDLSHDKIKQRLIKADAGYLVRLGLSDDKGTIFKNAQDKYKQINQYVEIIHSLLKDLPKDSISAVADMGSGKGYLTFALYDYLLKNNPGAQVTGVEFRQDLVDFCNDTANAIGYDGLNFVKATIADYAIDHIDLLIALHACDTATDDAIAKGIEANAKFIVVAPCCHKQIRREMERSKAANSLSFLTKYGIFLERQAEMVTDGIRTLILNYFGYKTKVLEFISDVHTPKNVLIVGVKSSQKSEVEGQEAKQDEILEKIKTAKAFFGIEQHYLEHVLNM